MSLSTMASAMAGLCSLRSARARILARMNETSFSLVGCIPCGPTVTGVAAPMLVSGAMMMSSQA